MSSDLRDPGATQVLADPVVEVTNPDLLAAFGFVVMIGRRPKVSMGVSWWRQCWRWRIAPWSRPTMRGPVS